MTAATPTATVQPLARWAFTLTQTAAGTRTLSVAYSLLGLLLERLEAGVHRWPNRRELEQLLHRCVHPPATAAEELRWLYVHSHLYSAAWALAECGRLHEALSASSTAQAVAAVDASLGGRPDPTAGVAVGSPEAPGAPSEGAGSPEAPQALSRPLSAPSSVDHRDAS